MIEQILLNNQDIDVLVDYHLPYVCVYGQRFPSVIKMSSLN